MFPESCDSILKNNKGQILDSGTASISIRRRTADFVSPFVPLMQMDSTAELLCLHDNLTTHMLTGKVYLSSARLLRLIELQAVLLPNAEQVLPAVREVSAELQLPPHGIFPFRRTVQPWKRCSVLSVSFSGISIRCNRLPYDEIGTLLLRIGAPIFSEPTELSLHLTGDGILFGKQARYDCTYSTLTVRQAAELAEYIRNARIFELGATV